MTDIPFYLFKKVVLIQQSGHQYSIDEDGNGYCHIDGYSLGFVMNEYGEILISSIFRLN